MNSCRCSSLHALIVVSVCLVALLGLVTARRDADDPHASSTWSAQAILEQQAALDRPLPLGALHSLQTLAAPDQPTVLTRRRRADATASQVPPQDAETRSEDDGWIVVFEEEFDGPEINSTRWNVRNNYTHGNQEISMYMADRVYLQDGNMVLRTDKATLLANNGKTYHYVSGWVDSMCKVFYQFGKFEVVAKLPNTASQGIWPAHWLLPTCEHQCGSVPASCCWPVGGEIDIIESVATPMYSGVCGSYRHSHNYTCCCGENSQIPPGDCYPEPWQPQINYTAEYHTFAVEWNATALVFSVDGNRYHTRTVEQSPIPETPMYWIFDTAVPNFWPIGKDSLYPVYHLIDRVRVYQRSGYGLAADAYMESLSS